MHSSCIHLELRGFSIFLLPMRKDTFVDNHNFIRGITFMQYFYNVSIHMACLCECLIEVHIEYACVNPLCSPFRLLKSQEHIAELWYASV